MSAFPRLRTLVIFSHTKINREMIMYLDIDPKSPQLERLQKMQKECSDIQYAVENEFYETQREKAREITEKVQQFVDEWRSAIQETQLSQRDKSVYNTLLGAAFNQLPSYNELSTHFLTQAVRYDQRSAPAYYELGVSLEKAGVRRRAELSYAQALRCVSMPSGTQDSSNTSLQIDTTGVQVPPAAASSISKVLVRQAKLLLSAGTASSVMQASSKAREAHSAAPNSAEACFAVASALLAELRLGMAPNGWELQLSKAACMLRKALQVKKLLQQRAPATRFSLGVVERLRLNFKDAYEHFSQAYAEDPAFLLARQAAHDIEALMQFLKGGLKQRALEPCSLRKPESGLAGLIAGKNKEHTVKIKLLRKFEAKGQPFFVAQGIATAGAPEPRRCAFTPGPIAQEAAAALQEGVVVELQQCVLRKLYVRTNTVEATCWCVCADGDAGHVTLCINNQETTIEVRPELLTESE